MPACGEIHKAMQEVTDLSDTGKGAVHKDLTPARIKRDTKDLTSVLDFVANRTPFACNTKELQSLSSGIIGKGPVNVDTAKTIGESILASMEGQSVQQHTFSKKAQVNSLASVVYVAVDGGKIAIEPQQLYQRLLVDGVESIELSTLFKYELCSYPSSLFDSKLLMRLADKADLQNVLVKKVHDCVTVD